jgi:predicted RND superfamily exporter protein
MNDSMNYEMNQFNKSTDKPYFNFLTGLTAFDLAINFYLFLGQHQSVLLPMVSLAIFAWSLRFSFRSHRHTLRTRMWAASCQDLLTE